MKIWKIMSIVSVCIGGILVVATNDTDNLLKGIAALLLAVYFMLLRME